MIPTPDRTAGQRALALAAGLLTHGLFLAGVGSMAWSLFGGMDIGVLGLESGAALLVDALLVIQFPLLHSFFLGQRGGSWVARRVPLGLGRDLATTTFAAIASLQLVVTFLLWCPTGIELWRPQGAWMTGWEVVYGASWLLLLKAMGDAGLGVQTGSLGWTSVVRGAPVRYGGFPREGLFRRCRQPVYFAFAVLLWAGPVWTLDHLVLAAGWSAYCYVGPRFKERRYLQRHGRSFAEYRRRVPYWFPGRVAV